MHGTIGVYLASFAHDTKVAWALGLIAIDLILGVGAALNKRTFTLAYIADTLRRDILGKLFPWFVLYATAKASHSADVAVGIDFNMVADGAFALLVAALVGSITSSLATFGIALPAPLARGEVPPPTP